MTMAKKLGFAPLTFLVLSTVLAACYARHFPTEESRTPTQVAAERVDLTAAVAKAETQEEQNIARIKPNDVVELFAKSLDDEHFFNTVIFPYTESSPIEPDVILEVSVMSTYDLHTNQNFLKGIAIGLSLLLLQPLLPTEYDLSVHLAVRAISRDRRPIKQYDYRNDFRFEYTVPRPSEESIIQWHKDAYRNVVEAVINEIKQDRAALLRAT